MRKRNGSTGRRESSEQHRKKKANFDGLSVRGRKFSEQSQKEVLGGLGGKISKDVLL